VANNITKIRRSKSQTLSFTEIQGKQIGIKPNIYILKILLRFVSKLELFESATIIIV
jgi:hypothetical protein